MISKKKTDLDAPQILADGDPVLRQVALEVPVKDIASSETRQVILDMRKALASQSDGIGLAAPQIGIPLRIFIVSRRIFNPEEPGSPREDLVFINPVIVKESKEKKWMDGEGCLSVRWLYGKVKRSTKVTLRAYTENGQVIERGASGLLAHIFQHEVDHLNGILFIDKAKDLERIEPKKEGKKPTKAESGSASAARTKAKDAQPEAKKTKAKKQ